MERWLRFLLTFTLFFVWLTASWGQPPVRTQPRQCATPDLTNERKKVLSREASLALRVKRAMSTAQASITYVPIKPHIFRRANGRGGLTLAKLNNIMAVTNRYNLQNGTGIQFYFCGTTPDYIDNDTLFNSFPAFNETSVNGRDARNAMNQYYVNAFSQSGLGGYAYFPENSLGSTRSFILNEADEEDLANRLLPHELGHNFGLYHTFGNNSNGTAELVTRGAGANCTTEGDELCDTPADPYGLPNANTTGVNGCEVYVGTAIDAQGNAYAPSITNIMSYYYPCTHDFTPGQYERMMAGLALRQTHTAYSLDCPPTLVAAPTNVAALVRDGHVRLTWQDNATNEMGYFIERSTAANTGFVPIGGVGPNTTVFTDAQTAGATTYFYRIRPSNAAINGVSAAISIVSAPCRPIYGLSNCTFGDGLSGLTINSTTLNQNSGCSLGGYGSFTTTTASVVAGRSFSFSGSLIQSGFPQGVSIWADLNRNGLFEANLNELLYRSEAPITGSFSGTLTLSASLAPGPLSLRVISAYQQTPLASCSFYKYGETEDYQLIVLPPPVADLSVSLQVSSRTPMVGQPVSYSLVVHNSGPDPASGIRWQSRLPASLSFVTGNAEVSASASVVSNISAFSLDAGSSRSFSFQARPTQPGTYLNAAQLIAVDQNDPDSRPDSGTGDGQDDAATADIRTIPTSAVLFVSPNPNQTPSPSALPNQPPADPTKADLSVNMVVSSLTPKVGQAVAVTVIISNAGGLSASNVAVRDTLRGLTLVSSSTAVSVVSTGVGYTVIQRSGLSIPAGQSAVLIFSVMPTQAGSVRNAAQIWAADPTDPDSRPGSITPTANNLNGEDDVTVIDLRVGT